MSRRHPLRLPRRVHTLAALTALATAAACADRPTPSAVDTGPSPSRAGVLAAAPVYADDFEEFDEGFWSREVHPLGRTMFRAENVRVEDGHLLLVHPAGTLDGGEIRSHQRFGYGAYEARLQTPRLPGSITAFFLYQGVARSDEIDIEIFNDGSRRIMFTTWVGERQTNHVTRTLPFDPAAGFHTYRIEWANNRVRFLVDGILMQEFTKRVPRNSMYLMANSWWPTWIGGPPSGSEQAARFDAVTVWR